MELLIESRGALSLSITAQADEEPSEIAIESSEIFLSPSLDIITPPVF